MALVSSTPHWWGTTHQLCMVPCNWPGWCRIRGPISSPDASCWRCWGRHSDFRNNLSGGAYR